MAENQNFRSAFNGFNREDVVRYIEYSNNQHSAQVAQLQTELEELRAQLTQAQAVSMPDTSDLEARLQASEDCCASLRSELAQAYAALEQARNVPAAPSAPAPSTTEELEAYRRAERAERAAQERAAQLCNQANAALAEATTMVDQAAEQLGTMANDIAAQMNQFRDAVIGTKSVLADAAAAMYAIRPVDPDKK